jgi:RNA polymerase-binding transcription factor DksA
MMTMREKTKYSDEELVEFKILISSKLKKAQEELQLYMSQLNDRANNDESKAKGLEDGIGTVELERMNTLAARQKKYIQHLENALIRIENKVYGICRESGKLIQKERLMAVPHATLSIAAKESRVPIYRNRNR